MLLKYLQVGQQLSRGSQNQFWTWMPQFQVSSKGSHLFQDLNVSDFTLTYFSCLYNDVISKAF